MQYFNFVSLFSSLGNVLSVDLSDANGQSVCQHLIDQGYAKERIPTKKDQNTSQVNRYVWEVFNRKLISLEVK